MCDFCCTFVPKLRECAHMRTDARNILYNKNQFFMIDREYRNPI